MKKLLGYAILGLLLWVLAFAFSLVIFPLKAASAPLFHNLMTLAMFALSTPLILHRMKGVEGSRARLGAGLGFVVMLVNYALDIPVFIFGFGFSWTQYFTEIGAIYPLMVLQPWAMGLAADKA